MHPCVHAFVCAFVSECECVCVWMCEGVCMWLRAVCEYDRAFASACVSLCP